MKYDIAVVGVTGMVGKKMLEVLEERKIAVKNFYPFASAKSAGSKITFQGKEYEVLELSEKNVSGKKIDFALFSIEADLALKYAPIFALSGARVIDNSSAFRLHDNIPLVVPEVNMHAVKNTDKIIANPNCSTIQAVVPLAALHKAFGIKRVVYSTYQAVSGAGQQGYDDLLDGVRGVPPQKFPHKIFDNLIPHIDSFLDDGYTKEEQKMILETKKILNEPKLKVTATTVRVPILNGHSESINIEFKKRITLAKVRNVLERTKGIIVYDDVKNNIYPMPATADGRDEVFVGRIRMDNTLKSGINMFVVADNIRKGAATNAVQIMESLMKNN